MAVILEVVALTGEVDAGFVEERVLQEPGRSRLAGAGPAPYPQGMRAKITCLVASLVAVSCYTHEWVDPPYWPTPQWRVEQMLDMADVTASDVVYDLGSGDGRIVITAAQQYGARGVGIEIDPALVQRSEENAREAGVADRTRFLVQDFFETDLSEATVVTLYLYPKVNEMLKPQMAKQLGPDARIVTYRYEIPGWTPVEKSGPIRRYAVPSGPPLSSSE